MGFYENGLERVAAVCVGSASIALGGLGAPGVLEASIGLAGLAGFVIGKNKKFGPECSRVQKRIRKKLLSDYRDSLKSDGDSWHLSADLEAANSALENALVGCFIDRKKLAASAVTVSGFPNGATALLLKELGEKNPDLFAESKSGTLAYRFARDVIREGIEAAIEDPDYYRKLEPILMLEMAGALGIIHAAVDAIRDDIRSLQSTIDALISSSERRAREFGIKEGLLLALVRRYAPNNPEDFDTALQELERALDVARQEAERDALPSNIDAALDAVLARVDDLNGQGDLDAAQAAIDAEIVAMDEEDARRDAARSRLYEKGLAQSILTRSVEGAVRFLLAGIKLETDQESDELERIQAIREEWFERGRDKGLNFDLEVVIALDVRTLEERTRERVPLDWAATQNNLGNVLWTLGERESGTARLEEAGEAYRAALEERTRERVPLDWGATQANLGNVLSRLGERESGTARLEEAVEAYRAALEERTRERVPLGWAATQNNLGNVLWTLGERESGTARLEEAGEAYRAALEERTRERVPLDWAATQNNLGNVLWTLGERESGTARLEEAGEAYRAALEERTRERVPLDWAATQTNLGNVLWTLGERESGTARLEEAVTAYRAALEERTRERVPLDWAATQTNLGIVLSTLGERESGTARLEEAVTAYRAALEERTRERVPLDWAATQTNLGIVLSTLGERESGTARLEEAVTAYRAALEERTRERVPLDWAATQTNLGEVSLVFMSKFRQRQDDVSVERYRKTGLEHVENALCVFNAETSPAYHAVAISVREELLSF